VQELRARGIILGVFEGIHIEERRIVVEPGDVLLFYTDGIPEALNAEERMMGMQRLVDVLKRNAQRDAHAITNAIVSAYNEFTGDTEQSDDVTFFVVKRDGDKVTG
jgi:sigma-B regulation protein RsbU (phosphoserine phosphatase)